jgi:hypothetical protein
MVGVGEMLVGVGELSATRTAAAGVADGSSVLVGGGVAVVVPSKTKGPG